MSLDALADETLRRRAFVRVVLFLEESRVVVARARVAPRADSRRQLGVDTPARSSSVARRGDAALRGAAQSRTRGAASESGGALGRSACSAVSFAAPPLRARRRAAAASIQLLRESLASSPAWYTIALYVADHSWFS